MAKFTQTMKVGATTPHLIQLGKNASGVKITATAEAWVQVGQGLSAPGAPTFAANGDNTPMLHLNTGNLSRTIGVDLNGQGFVEGLTDPIDSVAIYAVAAGEIEVIEL